MAENNLVFPLKQSSEYSNISKNGFKKRVAPWLTLLILKSDDGKAYFGMTVSKKVGKAVLRNKLKRWVRHSVRTEIWSHHYRQKKVVFMFRTQKEGFYENLKFKDFQKVLFE